MTGIREIENQMNEINNSTRRMAIAFSELYGYIKCLNGVGNLENTSEDTIKTLNQFYQSKINEIGKAWFEEEEK